MTTTIAPNARCDFCSSRPVVGVYPCDTFTVPNAPGVPGPVTFADAWAACERCRAFIDAGLWDELATRQARLLFGGVLPQELTDALATPIRNVHEGFRAHRRGTFEPVA